LSFSVRVDMTLFKAYLDFLSKAIKEAADEGLHVLAHAGQAIMVAEAPERTGTLRRSITIMKEGDAYVITPLVSYAVYVERGTRPHEIVARRARALRFVWRGSVVFFRRVLHPGTRPDPFISRTRDRVSNIATEMMAAAFREVLR